MKDFGYDIENFYEIDPMFGTMEDIETLFKEAAKRNIKIVLDFVPNHSSDESEWFKKSVKRDGKYTDYYIWADGKTDESGNRRPPNNWVSTFYGSAWTWNDERKQYYYHNFGMKITISIWVRCFGIIDFFFHSLFLQLKNNRIW